MRRMLPWCGLLALLLAMTSCNLSGPVSGEPYPPSWILGKWATQDQTIRWTFTTHDAVIDTGVTIDFQDPGYFTSDSSTATNYTIVSGDYQYIFNLDTPTTLSFADVFRQQTPLYITLYKQ